MEFDLIRQLKSQVPADPRVSLGIGDDCAILTPPAGYETLITTDLLLDGVHFLTDSQTFAQIAYKSLAANVSDIAAMGGEPIAAFLSLALPRSWSARQAEELLTALAAAARQLNVVIAGGDTTTWKQPLAINVTLYGQVEAGRAVLRSGAQPGDVICVSGPLGGSLAGRHLDFTPRVQEARWLTAQAPIHAMMDLSDGLISDLGHILEASQVGAELYAEQIPISPAAQTGASDAPGDKSPLERALSDGEDFELLWTMAPTDFHRLTTLLKPLHPQPISIIPVGHITSTPGLKVLNPAGEPLLLNVTGYRHELGGA